MQVDAVFGRPRSSVANVLMPFRLSIRDLLLAVAILALPYASHGAEGESGGGPRTPKIEEGNPAPWLEYYRRERGSDWPSSSQGESNQAEEGIVAPSADSAAVGAATDGPGTVPERSPARPSPTHDRGAPR